MEHVNPDKKYCNWDRFFQDQAGAHAVRNRKEYFQKRCEEMDKGGVQKRVLILGSGPATDVKEYLEKHPGSNVHFDLVDFDQNAINFAKAQNRDFEDSIDYFKINVLRFKPFQWYDLISLCQRKTVPNLSSDRFGGRPAGSTQQKKKSELY